MKDKQEILAALKALGLNRSQLKEFEERGELRIGTEYSVTSVDGDKAVMVLGPTINASFLERLVARELVTKLTGAHKQTAEFGLLPEDANRECYDFHFYVKTSHVKLVVAAIDVVKDVKRWYDNTLEKLARQAAGVR